MGSVQETNFSLTIRLYVSREDDSRICVGKPQRAAAVSGTFDREKTIRLTDRDERITVIENVLELGAPVGRGRAGNDSIHERVAENDVRGEPALKRLTQIPAGTKLLYNSLESVSVPID